MKTLESIREEIWEEMLRLEDKRKDRWADIKYQTLREVLQKLGHLDEPETLSQKWIDKHSYNVHLLGTPDVETVAIPRDDLQNLLVPKQEEQSAKTVADVIADFYKSLERLKEVLRTEVEELEE